MKKNVATYFVFMYPLVLGLTFNWTVRGSKIKTFQELQKAIANLPTISVTTPSWPANVSMSNGGRVKNESSAEHCNYKMIDLQLVNAYWELKYEIIYEQIDDKQLEDI